MTTITISDTLKKTLPYFRFRSKAGVGTAHSKNELEEDSYELEGESLVLLDKITCFNLVCSLSLSSFPNHQSSGSHAQAIGFSHTALASCWHARFLSIQKSKLNKKFYCGFDYFICYSFNCESFKKFSTFLQMI